MTRIQSSGSALTRGFDSRGIATAITLARFVLACVLGLNGACLPFRSANGDATASERGAVSPNATHNADSTTPTIFDRPMQRIVVRFSVLRVWAPKGTFTENEDLWKLVTGALPSADAAMRLRDNGFRAAVGTEGDRSLVKRHIDRIADIRTALDQVTPDASRLVELDLGPCNRRQPVFSFDRAGQLHGRTFVQARAKFRLAYEMRSPRLDEMLLRLTPEIEEPPGPWKWVITDEGARQVQQEKRYAFHDLVIAARISQGGFLLLGPSADVYRQPLPAKAFFVNEAAETGEAAPRPLESILIINPIIETIAEQAAPGEGERS